MFLVNMYKKKKIGNAYTKFLTVVNWLSHFLFSCIFFPRFLSFLHQACILFSGEMEVN